MMKKRTKESESGSSDFFGKPQLIKGSDFVKVVGITTQQEFYVGSKERNFRINEFLLIQDPF
ncbi:MAG: hypothetical protein ACQEP4_07760, partial [Bacillota bacterium]